MWSNGYDACLPSKKRGFNSLHVLIHIAITLVEAAVPHKDSVISSNLVIATQLLL